jgi:hypothetical protein
MGKSVLAISLAGLWITISEFLRNEFLLQGYWLNHYQVMGLEFTTSAAIGILWTLWSFLMAYLLWKLLSKFNLLWSLILTWLPSFLMMWIVINNLQVLPYAILPIAIPLSVLEIWLAGVIIGKIDPNR